MTDRELDRDNFKHEVRELLAQLIADTQMAPLGGGMPDPAAVADKIAALAERTRFYPRRWSGLIQASSRRHGEKARDSRRLQAARGGAVHALYS